MLLIKINKVNFIAVHFLFTAGKKISVWLSFVLNKSPTGRVQSHPLGGCLLPVSSACSLSGHITVHSTGVPVPRVDSVCTTNFLCQQTWALCSRSLAVTLKTSLGLPLATSGNTLLISDSVDAKHISGHPANSFWNPACITFTLVWFLWSTEAALMACQQGQPRYCLVGRGSSVHLDLKEVGGG